MSMAPANGICSKCGTAATVVMFTVIVEAHSGEAEPLCKTCLFDGQGLHVSPVMEPLAPGPAPRRKALRSAKRTSLRQELDIQEEYGARMQPGSGNQPGKKGDHRRKGELRLEAKYTEAESYRLQLDDLYKISGEAAHGELAVLLIDFLSPGTRKLRDRFAVIHDTDFKELHAARKNRGPQRSV
jgi:hypothetical protein